VRDNSSSQRIDDTLQAQIEKAYPGYRYPLFVTNGLGAVWAAQGR